MGVGWGRGPYRGTKPSEETAFTRTPPLPEVVAHVLQPVGGPDRG